MGRATAALDQAENAWVTEMIFQALAVGEGGANGMQRAFRRALARRIRMSPQQIASVTNNFPSLLQSEASTTR